MAKTMIQRLDDTLDQIQPMAAKYPRYFTGISAQKLRAHLFDILKDDPYLDLNEVSEDLSLGGHRVIKVGATTSLRHLKRLTLLIHRVMGYHSSLQTRQLKARIQNSNEQQTLNELSSQLSRGVQLMSDSLRDWLQKTAMIDGGSLVHYYDQGDDNRLNDLDITEYGWCLGVSTQWLRFKGRGKADFWKWMLTDEGAGAIRFVMAAQETRIATGASLDDRAGFAMKRFGLRLDDRHSTQGAGATPTAMAQNIASGNGGPLCRIGQGYVGGGGHAMAAATLNGVTFMDPNAGEIHFANAQQLLSWLPKFVRRIGYHFAHHYVERFTYHPDLERRDEARPLSTEEHLRQELAKRRRGQLGLSGN